MGNVFRCIVQELDYPILKNNLETSSQLNTGLVCARSYSGIAFQNSKLILDLLSRGSLSQQQAALSQPAFPHCKLCLLERYNRARTLAFFLLELAATGLR